MFSKYRRIVTLPIVGILVVGVVLIVDDFLAESKAKAGAEKIAALEVEEVAKIDESRFSNFRDTYWGMTRAQVKFVEKWDHNLKTTDMEWYKGEIFNTPCLLTYHFRRDESPQGLYFASYYFDRLEEAKAFTLQIQIARVLQEKYGPHDTNSMEQNRYEWRWLISDGETTITLVQEFSPNYPDRCTVAINYSERKFIEEGKKKHAAKKQAELEEKKRTYKRMHETSASNF